MTLKKIKELLTQKHILCFAHPPEYLIKSPSPLNWFSSFNAVHDGASIISTFNHYVVASVSHNAFQTIRVIANQFPAVNLSLNLDNTIRQDDHFLSQTTRRLVQRLIQLGVTFANGLDIFIQDLRPVSIDQGIHHVMLILLLEIFLNHSSTSITLTSIEKLALLGEIEGGQDLKDNLFKFLSVYVGGTMFIEQSISLPHQYQSTRLSIEDHRFVFLDISRLKGLSNPFQVKQIKDQLNMIAHHYSKDYLQEIDALQFSHDFVDLTRMYGSKTTNKAKFYFAENIRVKKAFLSLDKDDEGGFVHQLEASQIEAEQQLKTQAANHSHEELLMSTISYIRRHYPHITIRVLDFGLQGPLLLIVPRSQFASTFNSLVRQFQSTHIHEIKFVNQGLLFTKV